MNRTRAIFKTTLLLASLVECLLRFALLRVRRAPDAAERALWLHQCCRRITKRLGIVLDVKGTLPKRGLIVSNHLSHLDILLYGALGPVVFVAKQEVRNWPLLGSLAACGGTIFVDRGHPAQAALAAQEIEACLRSEVPVLLFPEGTSSDGSTLLPFRSPLFEPAIRAACPITAAAIGYAAADVAESELAYFGEKVFFPHLALTLGRKNLRSCLAFGTPTAPGDRKRAAGDTHADVCRLRSDMARRLETSSLRTQTEAPQTEARTRASLQSSARVPQK